MSTNPSDDYEIVIYQLGLFECFRNGTPVQEALSRKTRAILAYLASSHESYSRHLLYNIFCQDTEDPSGTLRWHLSRIRRLLHEDILDIDNQHVRFNHQVGYVDSVDFQTALSNNSGSPLSFDSQIDKIKLYRGEFLSGLNLRNAPEFEFWLSAERTRMAQLYERGLIFVIDQLIIQEHYPEAITWSQRLLQTNPVLEMAHARLMWLYARIQQRENAIKQFQLCTDILQGELAVEPSDECKRLHDAIVAGDLPHFSVFVPLHNITINDTTDQPTQFFGRDEQMDRLFKLWQSTLKKENSIALIDAEAGGGKTRLVNEFVKTLPQHRYLVGNCYESSRYTPYQPWIELLEPHLQETTDESLNQIDSFWLDQLSYLLPSLSLRRQATANRSAFNEMHLSIAILHFLNLIQPPIPIVILLDNIQWADEASLRLFQVLTRRVHHYQRTPMLLLGLYRTEELNENSALLTLIRDMSQMDEFQKISLPPLDALAVRQLVNAHWKQIDPAQLTEKLLQVTGGNPLYLTEVLDELDDDQVQADSPEIRIPASLIELVQRRLQQVSDNERQVIDALAVINMPVSSYVLQSVSGRSEDEVFSAIDSGLQWRLFRAIEDDTPIRFTFRHDLIRDAVRQHINAIRRERLHKRSAEKLLEMRASSAEIAYHWHGAGDIEQEAVYVALAGKEAAKLYANTDAKSYFQRAIEITRDQNKVTELWVDLGNALYMLEDWDSSDAAFQEALRRSHEQKNYQVEAEAYATLGRAARFRGQYERAIEFLTKAEQLFTDLSIENRLSITLVGIGSTYLRQADTDRGLEYIERALEIAQRIGDANCQSMAYGTKGEAYLIRGEFDKVFPLFQESLRFARMIDDRRGMGRLLNNLGHLSVQKFDYGAGWNYCAQAAELLRQINDASPLSLSVVNLAVIAHLQGVYDKSMLCNEYALMLGLEINDLRPATIALAELASIYVDQGFYEKAGQLSHQAIQLGTALNLRYEVGQWQYQEVKRLHKMGKLEEALAVCTEAIELAREINRNDHISVLLNARDIHLKASLHFIDIDSALECLTELLQTTTMAGDEVIVHDTIWQIDPSQEEARQRAASLYKELYTQNADIQFYNRYAVLTGETLAKSTLELDLPKFISESSVDLDHLLQIVSDTIENMNNIA